ncbi:MAG: PEP-CTERM sorting domain-containing protein [Planctomycetes bacterium]|nr:PEP-CTERM sorting domain-containing protein [Planctomycetota bacterium]
MTRYGKLIGLVAAGVLAAAAAGAHAGVIRLEDGNTVALFDPTAAALQFAWYVDGTNYLREQGFWYRLDGEGAGGEAPLADLGLVSAVPLDTTGDGLDDMLRLKYAQGGLTVEVIYTLVGGTDGSGWADLTEVIRFTNRRTVPVVTHFFQYVDFDLSAGGAADTAWIHGGNTARQTGDGLDLAETVDTPPPTQYAAALTPEIRDALGDGGPTNLGLAPGPVTGDATWSFQWDFSLPAGGSYIISKDKSLIVPEPATVVLMGLGAAALGLRRRKR